MTHMYAKRFIWKKMHRNQFIKQYVKNKFFCLLLPNLWFASIILNKKNEMGKLHPFFVVGIRIRLVTLFILLN